MSRSVFRTPRRPRPAFAHALLACVTLLALLAPSAARAGTPYSLEWARAQAAGSCETADLGKHDGDAYFQVNDTPLPTYQVPGALVTNADGSQSNVAEAGFDSVLLHTGSNGFAFGVVNETGDDSCVYSHEVVHLVCVPLGIDKLLFDVVRNGTGFVGNTQVDLSLAEINPPLAQDIANLEAALAAERETLFEHAAETADLAEKLDALQQLDAELHDLVTRPLDEIAQEDLAAILDKYAGVLDDATRAAVEQLLADVQKSLDDLRAELASLLAEFGAQADAAADLVTASAAGSGFDPEDPWGYALGTGGAPPVDCPDVSSVPGAFDPDHDPYDAYANAVIDALADDVTDGKVTARVDFVAQVDAWRANDAAIAKALAADMNVSQAETSAFLKAETKVTAYVHQFMNAQWWFNDSLVPPDVRAAVDGVLKNKFDVLADQMKLVLNDLDPSNSIDLSETQIFQTIVAFGGAMSAIDDVATPYFEMMATLVQGTERVMVGVAPFVGPTLDFCEAVTGRAWCMPNGEELSTEERIFSGAGVAIGSVATFWAGVKGAGVGAKSAAVAGAIAADVDEDLGAIMRAQASGKPQKIRGAMKAGLSTSEKQAVKAMHANDHYITSFGDDAVRDHYGIPKSAREKGISCAPDFRSVKDGKVIFTEAKGENGALHYYEADHAVQDQLGNAVKAAQAKGEPLGTFQQIALPKGVTLEDGLTIKNGYLYMDGKPAKYENFFIKVEWYDPK